MKLRTVFSFANFFLGWAPTTMSLFPSVHPSICMSVQPSVCRATYLRNSKAFDHDFWYTCVKWRYLQGFFFHFFEILIFWVVRGAGGGSKRAKNCPKIKKYISHVPYFRNSTAYDHDFWYTCVNNDLSRPFFHLFEVFFFQVVRGVKGQKIAQNEK